MTRRLLAALALIFSLMLTTVAQAKQYWVYVGTYTGKGDKDSKGIMLYKFDLASGKLTAQGTAATSTNPSFLAVHPSNKFLYAVGEVGEFNGKKTGMVTSFSIDPKTGKLTQLNQQSSGGSGPCHISIDKTGRAALAANYGSGHVASLSIDAEGKLQGPQSTIQHAGSSVNKGRQSGPHAHSINVSPDNRFALACDLGIDKVLVYRLDPTKGTIVPNDPPSASVAPGAGPRHLAFHPSGKFAYVINEMLCTMTAFEFDADKGTLKEIETVSTVPDGVKPGFSTAEVVAHPSGKFLYGSNRGHHSIVVYSIDEKTGKLKLVEHENTQGKTPRNFALDPTGTYLLAENQDSASIVVFKIDQKTGELEATGEKVEVSKPVCVRFVPAE